MSPGFGNINFGALAAVDENVCMGWTSSDPSVNNLEVSYTKMGPSAKPTSMRVSLDTKAMMLGAGAIPRVRLGLNDISPS